MKNILKNTKIKSGFGNSAFFLKNPVPDIEKSLLHAYINDNIYCNRKNEVNKMKEYWFVLMLAAGAVLAQDSPADGAKADAPAAAANPAAPASAAKAKPAVKLLPPRVRTGSIVKAEFTTEKPSSEGESAVGKKSSPAWAVLTLKLDPGRAASVFDYVLSKGGTEYPCLDIAEDNGAFSGKIRIYAWWGGYKNCRLVFAVPSAEDEYEVIFKLFAEDGTPAKLNVKPPPPEKKAEEEKKPEGENQDENKSGDGNKDENKDQKPAE